MGHCMHQVIYLRQNNHVESVPVIQSTVNIKEPPPKVLQPGVLQPGALLRQGSVKNLRQAKDPNQLWFEFTDDYSVFDWGKMPDPIPGKSQALARLAEYLFERLADKQLWTHPSLKNHKDISPCLPIRHHFLQRQQSAILVHRVDIPQLQPSTIANIPIYDYAYPQQTRQLIPLEVIFRFGVPKGSSLLKRSHWYSFPIHEGAEFENPLIEFSTKLESKDRILSYQEACLIMGGDTQDLTRLHGKTQAVALALKILLKECGLKLWDGKLEWARWDDDFLLVDSIGPDELRVSQQEAVFSKQFLRDFYLSTPWMKAIDEGHRLAKARAQTDWTTIVKTELRQQPPPLTAPWLHAAAALYQDFCTLVIEQKNADNFLKAFRNLQNQLQNQLQINCKINKHPPANPLYQAIPCSVNCCCSPSKIYAWIGDAQKTCPPWLCLPS